VDLTFEIGVCVMLLGIREKKISVAGDVPGYTE